MAWQRHWGFIAAGCLMLLMSPCQAAMPPKQAVFSNVMELEQAYPEHMSTAFRAIKINDKELATYLSDPNTVCTVFMLSNKAMQDWMKRSGKYAGKAVQNVTFMHHALNYHVVPGKAFTADQIAKGGRHLSRANETLYFWRGPGGAPRVYGAREYPMPLNMTDIKAGKCIVHSVDMALVAPTSNQMVMLWMKELGTTPPTAPKAEWGPEQEPLPESREALAAASASSGVADTPAPGSKPASSNVQCPALSLTGSWVVVMSAVLAAGMW